MLAKETKRMNIGYKLLAAGFMCAIPVAVGLFAVFYNQPWLIIGAGVSAFPIYKYASDTLLALVNMQ